MTTIHRIRKEFGEPFRDVVNGFAIMGCSRNLAAKTMGIDISHLYYLMRQQGIDAPWRKQKDMIDICKAPGHKKGDIFPHPQRYSDNDLLDILRGYSPRITVSHYNIVQGNRPAASTIIKRFKSWEKAKRLAHGLSEQTIKNLGR